LSVILFNKFVNRKERDGATLKKVLKFNVWAERKK